MAPLHKNGKMVLNKIVPFDDSVYYHQRDRPATMSFKDYVVGTDQWNGPVQAGMYTQNDSKILGTLVKEKKATCGPNVPQQTECSCFPGNSGEVCPHYTTSLQVEGWMGGLGDLNHSHPFVQQELLNYAVDLVQDYGADALRLDTAIYLDLQFVKEVQQAVGVEILGEATVNNLTYQAYLMRDEKNERILTGLLNFPPFYQVPTAFCGFNMGGEFGDWSMQGTWSDKGPDMRGLGQVMTEQQNSKLYESLDLMGTFADNHDENARINYYCKADQVRIKNTLVWVLFSQGIPIIYYGTEQGLNGHQPKDNTSIGQDEMRESIWQSHYNTETWQYNYIKTLLSTRKVNSIGAGYSEVKSFDQHHLVFTRSCDGGLREAWVFLNNAGDGRRHSRIRYCPGPLPGINGQAWYDAISGRRMDQHLSEGCFTAPDAEPKVLVLRMDEIIVS
ncbi:unnamed protein product [Durusdinium trenchii]|uniref:Glycosyl hydrolase family 13 catalytic domain-containing protein n=1 Tax=Durusdinium trenchii TaxID=1381693 RepID=A0ABP0LMS5_9DINO